MIASLTTGGGVLGLLHAVMMNTGTIFPSPTDAAFAAATLTMIMEARRRLGHGEERAPFFRSPISARR